MATIANLFVNLSMRTAAFDRGIRGARNRLARFAANVERRLKRLASGIGQTFQRMGMVAGLGIGLVVKAFAGFSKQMAEVSTMLDDSGLWMDEYRARVREMSIEFGESTSTLAKGLYDILSASIAPARALDVLTVSARAAKAGVTDTGIAADAITTILNSYALGAAQAADVSDWLFTVVKRGKTTFAELAPQIGLVASTAASAGVSLEEMGALFAVLTRSGVRTENTITAVNQIIMSFLKPTKEATAFAKDFGVALSVAAIQGEGLVAILRKISDLPPDAIAKIFPNVRALRGAIPALKNFAAFLEDLELMGQRAGKTDAAFRKMAANMSYGLDQAKQAMIILAITIGEALAGPAKEWAEWLIGISKRIGTWTQKNRQLVISLAKVSVGLLVLGTSLRVLSALSTMLTRIGGALGTVAAVSGGATVLAFIALGAAIYYVQKKFEAAEAALKKFEDQSLSFAKLYMQLKEQKLLLAGATFLEDQIIAAEQLVVTYSRLAKAADYAPNVERWKKAADEMRAYADALRLVLTSADAAVPTIAVDEAAAKLAEAYKKLDASLREQLNTWGMTANEIAIYKLEVMGLEAPLVRFAKAQAENIEMLDRAKSVFDATRTPLERYETQIGKLSEMLEELGEGAWELYGRGVRAARAALEAATRAGGRMAPGELREIRQAFVDVRGLGATTTAVNPETSELKKANEKLAKIDRHFQRFLEMQGLD